MSKENKITRLRALVLLKNYSDLQNELHKYTNEFYDSQIFDIMGYYESIEMGEYYIEELQTQIKAFKNILDGFKSIKYIHG